MKTVDTVLGRIKEANLKSRPTKCYFSNRKIEFIGLCIKNSRIIPNSDNDKKIKNAPRLTTKEAVQSFLGLTGYYRNYIRNYSTVATPLTKLTNMGRLSKVLWTAKEEDTFQQLKKTKHHFLALHYFKSPSVC